MYQFIKYLKFKFKATNQHGVHSPFVYNLITTCFYDKTPSNVYKLLDEHKKTLLASQDQIQVTDLGEGSKSFKSNLRFVSNIAKTSGSIKKNMNLMYRLFIYFKPDTSLELGTSLGIATYAMALGHSKSNIISIEGCPNTSEYAKHQLNLNGIRNISFLSGHFKDVIPTLTNKTFDFIFFDGHHNKEATLNYFEMLLPKTHNDSVFIFDDINWSKGMAEAWNIIKQHPKVTVTIDTFFWGIVFFRKEQEKEHFKIRV